MMTSLSRSMPTVSASDLDQHRESHFHASCSSGLTTTTATATATATCPPLDSRPAKRARSEEEVSHQPRKARRLSRPTSWLELPGEARTCSCTAGEPVPLLSSSSSTGLVPDHKNSSPTTTKRRLLPAPSTSGSARYESTPPAPQPVRVDTSPGPDLDSRDDILNHESQSDFEHDPTCWSAGRKRKGSDSTEEWHTQKQRQQHSRPAGEVSHTVSLPRSLSPEQGDLDPEDPIQYWAQTQQWPDNFSSTMQERGQGRSHERSGSPRKRLASSSYTQRVKDGEVPSAYSPAYETYLAEHGIYMEEERGRAHVRDASKTFCRSLLAKVYPDPTHPPYPLSKFLSVWQRVQNRNEARVVRDLTPILVPSPELLYVGGQDDLEYVVDEVDAEWTKGSSLAGPMPKPDRACGISPRAFDEGETAKLKNYTAHDRPTLFTDHMYFPFLLCEVKCAEQGIKKADRQNMHSASMAVNGLARFLLAADPTTELSGEVLAVSISHDNERSKLYGHFVVRDGPRWTFCRYPIASFVLNFMEYLGWKSTHDFVRAVYEVFYPLHLARIRAALAQMEDPRGLSKISDMSIGESDDRDSNLNQGASREVGALSSQGSVVFKVPSEPASKRQKGAMALLQEQLAEQQRQSREQTALLERQLEEQRKQMAEQQKQNREQMALLERQLAEQQKQSKEQTARLEKQSAEQAEQYKEQIKLLNRLLERH